MAKNENLKNRTKQFSLAIVKFVEELPRDRTCDVLGRQLLRSGTSVGANYRSACRARSAADFISKLGIVEEEADETSFWLELLQDTGKVKPAHIRALLQEANELLAIMVASINTARKSTQKPRTSTPPTPNSELRTPHFP